MAVEIQNLSKRFGNKWVLRDASFSIGDGEVLGLCGAAGSGKTTLLRLIAGELKTNGGSIACDGSDITDLKTRERRIHLSDAKPGRGLTSLFRGGDHSAASGGEENARKLSDALSDAGSRVVMLDEPFGHMEPGLREAWIGRVRKRATHDASLIVASSDFATLTEVCDRIAMLSGDSILQVGTPEDIYEAPATAAIARLTGDVNLFEARRLTKNDAEFPEFYTIEGEHRIFAQPTGPNKLGPINQNVTLAIRAEQVVMSMGASFPEDNLLRGVVTGIRFRGATQLVEFDASGLRLVTRVFKVVGLSVGDECMLGLPPHRIRVLTK